MIKQRIAVSLLLISLTIGLVSLCVGVSAHFQQPTGIADNVDVVRSTVVHVKKLGVCQGSGVVLSDDGIIMTAKHVTDNQPGEYEVTTDAGDKYAVKYAVEDKDNDIAFLWLELPKGVKLPHAILSQRTPRVGDSVFIMGSPYGYENFNSVTLGIVSAQGRELGDNRYDWTVMMQTDSAAFPGNSGGPVLNMHNEVVGVLVAGMAEGLNYSVPVSRFYGTMETVRNWFQLQRFKVVEDRPEPIVQYGVYGNPVDGTD